MIKKVLLTGANGFIGQVLAKQLLAAGIEVKALVRDKAINPAMESVVLDLTEAWSSNPCTGVDTVFHLAGKAHALSEIAADDEEYRLINTEATRTLLAAAQEAGVKRFVFFSSVKAVGDMATMQDESNQTLPDTSYGQSKRAAEDLVLNGGYVPHPVVIRPCMVYGLSDKGNLPRMISAIKRGFFPPLPEVCNHRSMVHVEDLARAALLAAQNPQAAGQIYIVSDGQANSTRQLYEWICFALNKKPLPFSIPVFVLNLLAKIGDVIGKLRGRRFMFDSDALEKLLGSAWYSSAKIEAELGFKPQRNLQEALPEIVRYLQY
jgi:nucleoside-diphosphate-sugar epimerase